ncbi:MAG: M20/M25/M40 family metallo-hydrolase, partial [Pirellulales bacterium]
MQYRLRFFVAFALALFGGRSASAVEANARSAALASITTEEVTGHVNVLADDTFEGRESGTRGNRAAAVYIVERLKKLGLVGGGPRGSFYQTGNTTNNILALVEGRDAGLKDEVILIGGHYDHVGYGTYRNSYGPIGRIHNGADDNASGVAAVLEVADAVSRLPEKPQRSILFAFWDGEEKGLLGSKYWIDRPTLPVDRVRLAINVDMVGRLRNSRLEVYGIRTADGLRRLVSRQNDPALALDFNWDVKPDSDHYTFFSHDVPFLMLHTGMHDDYHRPSDDVEKINGDGLRQVAQLMFSIVVELADGPQLGRFRSQSRYESNGARLASQVTLRPPPGRLGIRWDEAAARAGTIVVAAVVPGSAAAVAGVRPGDRVVKFAGREVRDEKQFRIAVLAAENPVPAT